MLKTTTVSVLRGILEQFIDDNACTCECTLDFGELEHGARFVIRLRECKGHKNCMWDKIAEASIQ